MVQRRYRRMGGSIMTLKKITIAADELDAIRHSYADTKAAELDADMTQRLLNGLYLQNKGIDPDTGEPLEVDAREYLKTRRDDEDPLGGLPSL